jgi:O-antigen/teichoic acid export membrane protein
MNTTPGANSTWRSLGAVFHTLLAGWAVSLVVRFLAPRALGPEAFGLYASLDALAQTLLVIVSWGFLDWSARRAAEDPSFVATHAAAVLQSALLLCVPALALVVAAAAVLGHTPWTWPFFAGVGAWLLLGEANQVALRLRHLQGDYAASGRLTRRYRFAWGLGAVGVLGACAAGALSPTAAIAGLAAVGIVAEGARLAHLVALSRLHVFPPVPAGALRAVLVEASPFFTNRVIVSAYLRAPALLLGSALVPGGVAQMGQYGVALTVNNLVLMFVPALQSVILPALARARAAEEAGTDVSSDTGSGARKGYGESLARALTAVLAASGLVAGGLVCLAGPFVTSVFGDAYAPAAAVVRVTAPTLVVTYVLVLLNFHLILQGRERLLVRWSLAGLVVTVAASAAFLATDVFSAKAVGAAAASTLCEVSLLGAFVALAKPRAWVSAALVRAFVIVVAFLGAAYGVGALAQGRPVVFALGAATAWTVCYLAAVGLACGRDLKETFAAWRTS